MTSSTPRTRTGCQSCRLRHLKCDEQRPACSRCVKSGIECIRGYNIRFRHGSNPSVANLKGSGLTRCEYDFSPRQPWCRTSHNLNFIDETQELISIYDQDSDTDGPATPAEWGGSSRSARDPPLAACSQPSPPAPLRTESRMTSGSRTELDSPSKRRKLSSPFAFGSSFSGSPEQSSVLLQHSPTLIQHGHHDALSVGSAPDIAFGHDLNSVEAFDTLEPAISINTNFTVEFDTVSESLSRIYLDVPVWPLQSRDEADLMRYFTDHLASSFDLCDPSRHFALVVPQRAAICPILLNAVFAASARHLSRVSNFDPYIADRYHQECLKHLIPMLNDTAAIMDENLLAATVILRFLEEIEVPISGTDTQGHLLGTHVFISAQERSTVTGGLRQAAFWVGLRQEIYMAFVNQRSILPALEHCNIDRTLQPADDCTWANRIVVHCADVLRWCFGNGDHGVATYNLLLEYCNEWMALKPSSFSPVFYREPTSDDVFPEIWLLSDAVVTGLQHYYLAKILLTAHNPKVPRLGPGQKAALRAMDDEIKHNVNMLCGMAESNSRTSPNYVTASMVIAMAGDRFVLRKEQEALLGILLKTENDHGWPTTAAQQNLREAWGWIS